MGQINGQLFRMWKQAPQVLNEIGSEEVFLPYFSKKEKPIAYIGTKNEDGETWKMYKLQDNLIQVITKFEKEATFNPKHPEEDTKIKWVKMKDGDFHTTENEYLINAIHTFASARIVLNMFLRALQRLTKIKKWADFKWGKSTRLVIKVGEEANVKEYSHQTHTICFGKEYERNVDIPLTPSFRYTCRSFDLLAHEIGHAVLYTLRHDIHHGALHEAFGDLTAMFALLSRMDVCEKVIVITRGNLTAKDNFLMHFDEHYLHPQDEKPREIETERDTTPTKQVMRGSPSLNLYMLSAEISTAVFVCLVEAFYAHQDAEAYDPAESLFRVGRHIFDILLDAILKSDAQNITKHNSQFEELKKQMKESISLFFSKDSTYSAQLQDIVTRVIAPTQ
ncbi:MAG: hypothetical protein ACKVTZ_11805, partial [Bacteroidia bacterium]